jgi:hypothetical protein
MIAPTSYRRPIAYRLTWAACWLSERLGAAVPLDGPGLEGRALEITRRVGFLGTAFREPLDVLVQSLRDEARLSPLGRRFAALMLVQQLVTRLCLEEAWEAATPGPGDLLQPARPPLVIVGMHRTGTTLLHRLMAAAPAARPLLYWESFFPVMVPMTMPGNRSAEVRRERAVASVDLVRRLVPALAGIHETDPNGPEECHWLSMASLVTHAFSMQWRVAAYRDWLDGRSESGWEQAYREHLALLHLLDGGMMDRHWVLKCPLHAPRVETLASLLPTAIFVQTYRDIREVAGSLCSLTTAMRSGFSDVYDPVADGRDVAHALARDTRAAVQAAARHPRRVIHVHYKSLVTDPVATVRGIHERAGLPWSAETEAAMHRTIANNPRGRHGGHRYSLTDFGLTEAGLLDTCPEYVAMERRLNGKGDSHQI